MFARERVLYLLTIGVLVLLVGVVTTNARASAQAAVPVPLCETTATSEGGRLQLVGQPQITPTIIGTTQIGLRLRARVVNTNAATVNGQMTVTLFGADGSIAAVLDSYLLNILPGQEVTVESISSDKITTWARGDVRWQMTLA